MKSLITSSLLLLALLLPATAAAYDFEVDGIYYNINGNEATVTYKGSDYNSVNDRYSGEVSIPATVTNDGVTYAVTAIGSHAFYYCRNVTSVTIPNSVTTIGESAFFACSGLTSLDIPNSVTRISHQSFAYCSKITSLTIPSSVTYIGSRAFVALSALSSITVESGNYNYDSRDDCNALIETASNMLMTGCKNTIIPNTVTEIGDDAFDCCYDLTSITIPNSVTSIGNNAFHTCNSLTSLIIPNSVIRIGGCAFTGCSRLTSLYIPSSVISIGSLAFDSCSGLMSITVDSGNPMYDSRDNCNALIETRSNELLTGCQNTVIPNSVTQIASHAFNKCYGLTSISIPASVTDIGNWAFWDCSSLRDMYCYISDLSRVSIGGEETFFSNNGYSDRTLHVPHGTAAAYQADIRWYPYFGQIVEMEPETGLIGDVNVDGTVDIADINAVIDIIMGEDGNTTAADVNGDGEINIADINAIVAIIMDACEEHEWVDLGLPSGTLWATCNIGAIVPEEYGDYFAWGETEPKEDYNWETYKWCNGSFNSLTKYCTRSNFGRVDGKTELDPEDDAAYVNWGSSWSMPTLEQLQELGDCCTWQWATLNNVNGQLVTGPNGKTIFLPASGGFSSHLFNDGICGYYWSRTLCSLEKLDIPNEGEGPNDAYIQFFGQSRRLIWFDSRCDGQTIRAVRATSAGVKSLNFEQQILDLDAVPVESTHTGSATSLYDNESQK